MGLGPPTCKKCMRVMTGCHGPPGPYWKCGECGMDCTDKNSGNLWAHTDEELDIILKDDPEHREGMRKFKEFNMKQNAEAIARHKKRLEEESK